MQIKIATLALLAGAGAASAHASPKFLGQSGSQQGITQSNEYAIRNFDELCISKVPVPMCGENHVVKSFKNENVSFHCLSRNSMEAQRLKQRVENDETIPEMQGKPTHVQGRVQVPTKCVERSQVSSQEARRRKQQQQHGQRVQLIENDQQDSQDQYSENWEQEEDQLTNEEQHNRYSQHRSQEERQWQKMQELFSQYPELSNQKLHQIVKTDEGRYQQIAEQLRELVSQNQVTSHLMPQIQTTLPTYFSQVAKQMYNAVKEQKQQRQQNRFQNSMEQGQEHQELNQLVRNYQQFTDLMKRVYVYIVKESVKLNQQAPRRLANTPELVRKVWEKTRQEMTKSQIERTEQALEKIQELLELDQTNQLIVDELVSEQLKSSSRQARRNMMRVMITGLMMENSPSFEQRF